MNTPTTHSHTFISLIHPNVHQNTSRQRQITVYEGMRLSDLANNLKMTPREVEVFSV